MTTVGHDLEIVRADPDTPEIAGLIATHIERSRKYYPETSCHTYGPAEMKAEHVRLYAVVVNGEAVAIGGLKPLGPEGGEIKSMHTLKAWRGKGIGMRLMDHLIAEARGQGWAALFLETGSDHGSAQARAVYGKLGFELCPPFGDYVDDPLSVFMKRPL